MILEQDHIKLVYTVRRLIIVLCFQVSFMKEDCAMCIQISCYMKDRRNYNKTKIMELIIPRKSA